MIKSYRDMKRPDIKVKVQHSHSNSSWNIIGTKLGGKYKIARVPYVVTGIADVDSKNRKEALVHAEFIQWCFNNSNNLIIKK